MGLTWLVRARWRMLGAWMWPALVVLGVVDGIIGHLLPVAGDRQSVFGGIVVGLILNLIGVVLLARPLGILLRTRRADLPPAIARNYGGTLCVAIVTLGFLAIGVAHHPQIGRDRATMHDAVERAAAYIGDHAPAPFRADAAHLDTVVIQAGSVYRTCVANPGGTRDYCVVVNEHRGSVIPAGSESNQTLARGTD